MATLIPSLNQCLPRMTNGERRLARRLEEKLEDDYLLWYDVPIGGSARHPDFLVFNPRRGILVLEVKDWGKDTIQSIDRASVRILVNGAVIEVQNPFEQARRYAQSVADLLKQDPALVGGDGRLLVPWSFGVVLPNITRRQFEEGQLDQVLTPTRVICRDEMQEDVDPEVFQQRLWDMFQRVPTKPVTLPQIDRVRWHIFPELRLAARQGDLFQKQEGPSDIPDLIRVMDLQQEQLARSLGSGHRVIHGVAGSGKTMILGYRCLHLAKALKKPILVLCFNRALASWLEQLIWERGVADRVTVRTFHRWCRDQLIHYQVGLPPQGLDSATFSEQLVQRVIAGTDRGLIPREQYGAVLIDEGHDFQPEWLKLITQMVSSETNSLLLLYDDAQSIYQKNKFSFRSVGVQAQGRTTILRLNYRNTSEILSFAYDFAKDVLTPEDTDDDGAPLLLPRSAGRRGPEPELVLLPTERDEADYLAGQLRRLHELGTPWSNMALLYRTKRVGDNMAGHLRRTGIPFRQIGGNAAKAGQRLADDTVKLTTFHSSKGLEFPVVAIPGVRRPAGDGPEAKEQARLFYVAMTRAIDRLVLTGPGHNYRARTSR